MATAEAEGISGGTSTDGTTAGDTGRACLSFRFAFLTFLFALAFFFGFIFLGKVSSCYRLLHTADKVLNVGPSHDLAIAGIGRDDRRENFAGTLLMCSAHIALRNLLYERKLQETPKSRDAYTTTGSEKELASQLGGSQLSRFTHYQLSAARPDPEPINALILAAERYIG